jgi:hypothetical protein
MVKWFGTTIQVPNTQAYPNGETSPFNAVATERNVRYIGVIEKHSREISRQ